MVFKNGALFPTHRQVVNTKTKKKNPVSRPGPVPKPISSVKEEDPILVAAPEVIIVDDKEEEDYVPVEESKEVKQVVKEVIEAVREATEPFLGEQIESKEKEEKIEVIPEPEDNGPKTIEDDILNPPAPVKKKRKYTKRNKRK